MCEINGNANIHGESNVSNMCEIKGNVEIKGVSEISGVVEISGNCVIDSSDITGACNIWGNANIIDSDISGYFNIGENAYIDDVRLNGEASFHEDAYILNRKDYITLRGFGTEERNTTCYTTKDNGIHVICGCFSGSIDKFIETVELQKEGKMRDEYLKFAELAKYHFSNEIEQNKEKTKNKRFFFGIKKLKNNNYKKG